MYIYKYKYMNARTHTYTYIYIYLFMYVYTRMNYAGLRVSRSGSTAPEPTMDNQIEGETDIEVSTGICDGLYGVS